MVAGVNGLEGQLRAARFNVYVLTAAQAVLGAAGPISFAVGSLAGHQLLGLDKSLATAPLTGFNIGVAIGAVLIAGASRLLGRKAAFMLGGLALSSGGALAALALYRSDFWMFAAALLLVGLSSGFTQKIRFAAADASPSFYKARAISWILVGGILSAFVGWVSTFAKDLFFPVTFAGSFLMLVPLGGLAVVILSFLNLPPISLQNGTSSLSRPRRLIEVVRSQRFITGMVCAISTYALMTFMMTGAPLAMTIGCGFPPELASLGIFFHVLAMFAPSFFTGMLITRFGTEKVVAAGLVILLACAVVAHMGIALWNFWGALILLGLGWNFGFIGSTAIVASSYRPEEADKVQGFHDIVLFGTVALSSFASGKVFTAFGWNAMNLVIWPVALVCLALIGALLFKRAPDAR